MFVVYVLHKWTSKILPEKNILFREQGPSKFWTALNDRVDLVLKLPESFGLVYFISQVMIFWNLSNLTYCHL